jgi:hypothetical protein
MGWLFAVALGMQEGKRNAVWRALIPLTLGHALAIAAAIGVAMIAGTALSPAMLRWPVAILLAVVTLGSVLALAPGRRRPRLLLSAAPLPRSLTLRGLQRPVQEFATLTLSILLFPKVSHTFASRAHTQTHDRIVCCLNHFTD